MDFVFIFQNIKEVNSFLNRALGSTHNISAVDSFLIFSVKLISSVKPDNYFYFFSDLFYELNCMVRSKGKSLKAFKYSPLNPRNWQDEKAYCNGLTGTIKLSHSSSLDIAAHELTHQLGRKGCNNHLLGASAIGAYINKIGVDSLPDVRATEDDINWARRYVPAIGPLESWLDFYEKGRRVGLEGARFEREHGELTGLLYLSLILKGKTPEESRKAFDDDNIKKYLEDLSSKYGDKIKTIGYWNKLNKNLDEITDLIREDGSCFPKTIEKVEQLTKSAYLNYEMAGQTFAP